MTAGGFHFLGISLQSSLQTYLYTDSHLHRRSPWLLGAYHSVPVLCIYTQITASPLSSPTPQQWQGGDLWLNCSSNSPLTRVFLVMDILMSAIDFISGERI